MRGLSGAVIMLAISGCAETPSPTPPASSAAAQRLQASLEAFYSIPVKSCRHTILKADKFIGINTGIIEAIATNNAILVATFQSQVDALTSLCNDEEQNCGTGPARIGMTTTEAINTEWCFPDKKNTTEITGHLNEQWVYPNGYLYFDNGRLTAIQKTP
jgi:hypothetical protein